MKKENKVTKIALLTDGIFPITIGGMQKHSYYLTKNLADLGIKIDLYYIPHQNKKEEQRLIDEYFSTNQKRNINFIPIKWVKKGNFPFHYIIENYLYSKNIYLQLKTRSDYDFIYAKGFTSWYLIKEKRKGVSLPKIGVNFHGYEMFQVSPSIKYHFKKTTLKLPVIWINKNADHIFSYGGKITSIIKKIGIPERKIIEIPTGIDKEWITPSILKSQTQKVKFIFIGRYERRKGIEEINQSLKKLINREDFIFQFIGPIPANKQIKANNVIYYGKIMDQNKIKSILDNSDVLVCPSYSEGMPNVIMEGMARGLAVIASNVGAINHQVNQLNGILIEPGKPNQLQDALEKMLNIKPEKLYKMKKNSVEIIKKHFLWEIVATRTLQAISNAIENNS